MNTDIERPPPPWYRQPYVWLLIAFPAASVVAGLSTLVIASRTFDGLVVDDYYKRGMQINQELGRDRAAETRGLAATVLLEPGSIRFRILMTAGAGTHPPATIRVSFLHRTRAGFDRETQASLAGPPGAEPPFVYEAATPDLVPGHWDVLIEAQDWRLLESLTIP